MSHVQVTTAASPNGSSPLPVEGHPLSADLLAGGARVLTAAAVRRVALVAAEAASRFAGDDGAALAMEWMEAPRALFGGASALEACVGPHHCRRAVTLHALELDPDADDLDVDLVMAPIDDEEDAVHAPSLGADLDEHAGRRLPRLFVSEVSYERDGAGVWAFAATVANDEAHVLRTLQTRYGAEVAASATVRIGFDGGVGMARTLVSPALAETLAAVSRDPRSPLACGLDVLIEQRFRA